MSKRSAEDTIAGYYYQFDKTILEVLLQENNDTLITIEGIEDIDIENINGETTFIQCKYHSKTRYTPSTIKKPIQLLLREYNKSLKAGNGGIDFILYAHFKENQQELNSKLENGILKHDELAFFKEDLLSGTKDKIDYAIHEELNLTDEQLIAFIDSLKIDINAKDIDKQGKEVFKIIKETFNNCSNTEAEFYYNNALKIIFSLAIKTDGERQISKKDFIQSIDKKKFLFNKWYAHLKGKKQYLEYIKWKLKKSRALITNKHKYLFIGEEFLENISSELTFERLVKNIIDEYFKEGKSFSTKSKVWTIVLDCDNDKFSEYKKSLYRNFHIKPWGRSTTAGFDIKFFNEDPVINTNKNDRISKKSFDIKLITFDDFKQHQNKINKIDSVLFFSNKDYKEFFELETKDKLPFSLSIIEKDNKINSLDDINSIFDEVVSGSDYLRVISVEPTSIKVEVINPNTFKEKNETFSIGSFIKITDDDNNSIIGMLQSYKIKDINDNEQEEVERKEPSFILDIQPMGYMKDDVFKRGGKDITIPPNDVSVADSALLKDIFSGDTKEIDNKTFCFGTLSNDDEVDIILEGNNFFNKHIAVVGSSGSGKSCTVAQILHSGIAQTNEQKENDTKNNARVLIFDLHGEYKEAFPDCNYLSVDDLKSPYWLLNGEELSGLFIDSSESNSHNQYNQLKDAIILNKKRHNPDKEIDFDTPAYFSLSEVIQYIKNQNIATMNNATKEYSISSWNEELPEEYRLFEEVVFNDLARGSIGKGSFNGEFSRFLSRLQSRKNDTRLDFLLKSGEENSTTELPNIIKQFLGFKQDGNISNVTVVDLSGISFDVLSVAVSLISRLMFNFMYYAKKIHDEQEIENPLLLVYEEAHNYIPKHNDVKYRAVRESIERIAKEGRKYGVSAMIVSQRPSEISETIFSQCNSFVVMRLTNPTDQNYIKKLMPDSVSSITENLSGLESREALVLGSSIPMPTILRINELSEYKRPKSNDVNFMDKWKMNWNNLDEINSIIDEMVIPETN